MHPSLIISLGAALQILGGPCSCLRLTNMTAPALQDPRENMELHCRFDMGGEDLYAVKWYKDDQEFFRYTPEQSSKISMFPVDGVKVERTLSTCVPDGCDLLLKELVRPQSSGAYRCEVSSEAPAFRLASQTHNVTVAAVPKERPVIEGLKEVYQIGDTLQVHCRSSPGDPKPSLNWYINKQLMPPKTTKEITGTSSLVDNSNQRVKLKSTTSQLQLVIDKKLTKNQARASLEVTCESFVEGISQLVAPSLTSSKTTVVEDQNQIVNNQKLHSPFAGASRNLQEGFASVVVLTVLVRWC